MTQDSKQIAYCGLYCGDCIIRTCAPHLPARDLLATIKTPGFQKVASGMPVIAPEQFEALKDNDVLARALEAVALLKCQGFCKQDGGYKSCPVKACCQYQGLEGCWQCDEFAGCQTLAFLDPVHQGANLENLKVIREQGTDAFLRGERLW